MDPWNLEVEDVFRRQYMGDDEMNVELHSKELNELAGALASAQKDFAGVKKDKQGHGYKYAELSEVWECIREPLAVNGLSVVQSFLPTEGDKIKLLTKLMHKSGQYVNSVLVMPADRQSNKVQALGSASTYARRYGLMAIVGISPEDDDGAGAKDKKAPPIKSQYKELAKATVKAKSKPASVDREVKATFSKLEKANLGEQYLQAASLKNKKDLLKGTEKEKGHLIDDMEKFLSDNSPSLTTEDIPF